MKKIVKKKSIGLTVKILYVILGLLITFNVALIFKITRTEVVEVYTAVQNINDKVNYVQKELEETNNTINKRIANIPEDIIFQKKALEYKLQQVNVMVINETEGAMGSGVILKYNNQYYILTAGHMADAETDELYLYENREKICQLEIVKHDYTTNQLEDDTLGNDLLLLRPIGKYFVPEFYAELAEFQPVVSTEIYIVGNPARLEDIVSDGRIAFYKNNFMYYRDSTYYGNSGGGVYTRDGQLVGIVSHMYPISDNPELPPYMLYGAVRLSTIQSFMKDVK